MAITLLDLLAYEDDELAVLSVCASRRSATSRWLLAYGSLLLVPPECAATNWPHWRASQGALESQTAPDRLPSAHSEGGEHWLIGRAVMSAANAERWAAPLLAAGRDPLPVELSAASPLPALAATLKAPAALVRALPQIDSPIASLLTGLHRPALGLLWTGGEVRFNPPDRVQVGETAVFLPTKDLAGIHVTGEGVDPTIATARGIFVGRAERRAWLRDARGDGEFENYLIEIGWDPQRLDLADLEITHVERLNKEVVLSARVRLEDLDLSEVRTRGECLVRLPTLGRSVTHELLLHTAEGELLDQSGPHPIVERMEMRIAVNGHELEPIVSGITDPPPELGARLDRRDDIERELSSLLALGAQARIVSDAKAARERLVQELSQARGELLVLDRYFGQSLDDWRLLDGVAVPTRVLTGKLVMSQDGTSPCPAEIGAHVTARYRPRAPIHERIYVWEGGGVSVGGSPTTFGQAPVRFQRLTRAESDEWRQEFEGHWASGLFRDVPRAD